MRRPRHACRAKLWRRVGRSGCRSPISESCDSGLEGSAKVRCCILRVALVCSTYSPNPVRLTPGKLDKIAEERFALLGVGTMEDRQRRRTEAWMKPISGEKLVYHIDHQEERSQGQMTRLQTPFVGSNHMALTSEMDLDKYSTLLSARMSIRLNVLEDR